MTAILDVLSPSNINPLFKFPKTKEIPSLKVITHNGTWHADEILAIALLSIVHNTIPTVVRTRDQSIIDKGLIDTTVYVLDVGAKYQPLSANFDHHQRDFDLVNSFGNRYSTFGLVLEHLSKEFSPYVLTQLQEFANKVDCQDNGIQTYPELYWIAEMNALEDFDLVLSMAISLLKAKIANITKREILENNIKKAIESSKNGIVFSTESLIVNETLNSNPDLKLIVSPSSSGGYSIQSLNLGVERDFSIRCPTPESWRGLRDKELKDVSGFEGMVFSHATGFLTVAEYLVEFNSK